MPVPPGGGRDTDATMLLRAVDSDATMVLRRVEPDATVLLPPIVLPTPPAEPGDEQGSVAHHGAVMAMGSLVSRGTGFVRTIVLGAAIGAAAVSDAYNLANTLPNMVYELLLGGVLASVVVPLLVRAKLTDADRGEAYAQRLLSLATVFLAVATTLATLCAPLLTMLFTDDKTTEASKHLITTLSYLLLPEIFFYGIAAMLAAVLNTRGHFAAPMWTPILNNIVVIATAGVFVLLPTVVPLQPETITTAQVLTLGVGTTLGIVVQALGLWPALRRVGFRWKWRWDFRSLNLGQLGRIGAWMLVYVLVSQLGVVVIQRLANLAGQQGTPTHPVPGPAIFNNAYLLFMMVHGIVAVSIITALMPRMAAAAAAGRHRDLADQLSLGTRLSSVVLIPATVAYLVLGRQIGISLFQFGKYTHEQAIATGWVIAVGGLGLVPFAISQLQTFAFYAMPDTKTPALLNLPVVAVRIGLDLFFFVVLPAYWVASGLMAGNAISYVLATVLGYWLLRRRIGRLDLIDVFRPLGRLAGAAFVAGVVTWASVEVLTRMMGDGKVASIVQLVVGGAVLTVVYIGVASLLRVREVLDVVTMVRSRFRR
jgi:putative peptidoglycan lipid II flippase